MPWVFADKNGVSAMENISTSTGSWKSSLLQRIGVTKTVVAEQDRPNIRKYGAALMVAAAIALGSMAPGAAHAGPDQQSAQATGDFVSSQAATSNIQNSFGRIPSWSSSVKSNQEQRLADFDSMLQSSKHLSFEGKVNAVNTFFNKRIAYMQDRDAWGKEDYWATPLETLKKGAGDCEDFAIAKFFALEQLGVPQSAMKITYVKSTRFSEAHMVLLASKEGSKNPVVLDNMTMKALPFTQRTDLKPVYSFNEQSFFYGVSNKSAGGISNMSKWTDVLSRISTEASTLAKAGTKGPNPYDMKMMNTKSLDQSIEAKIELPAKQATRASSRDSSGPGLG